jgi:murein DD-endopeptidase MepM/ murein hydrolase activator NlpD
VVDLWDVQEEWSFPTSGALALRRERVERGEEVPADGSGCNPRTSFVTVPRMATPHAPGVPARARTRIKREEARVRARRTRRTAALLVVAAVCLVVLLVVAFGRSSPTTVAFTGPAPTDRLLPAGPPRPQVVAIQDSLRIQLPVNQSRVTAIGYHASGSDALALEPIGTQANEGLVGRLLRRLFGQNGSSLRYYLLEGGVGEPTGGLDIGAPVETDVYAPVDGSVLAVSDHIVSGRAYGVRIDIQPSGNPGVVVSLENLRADPALTVGSTVSSGRTKIGRIVDLSGVERAGLARYTQDSGQHVHIEVHPATSIASP